MHTFLRAIGINENQNLQQIKDHTNKKLSEGYGEVYSDGKGNISIKCKNSESTGIAFLCDNMNGENAEELDKKYEAEVYFPFADAKCIQEYEDLTFEKSVMNNGLYGNCDELGHGFSITFFVQNSLECGKFIRENGKRNVKSRIGLVGMSLAATVLMPVKKENRVCLQNRMEEEERNSLIKQAREGNQDAMEKLTLDDMGEFGLLLKRVENEDILSIVDTSIMPSGLQCDNYQIVGEILQIEEEVNEDTEDEIYVMVLKCKKTKLTFVINKKDVLGEPKIGRRIRARIWLQGKIDFDKQ